MSAIPWIGQDIVEFVWGGFSVNNATLNRFFSLHFLLPFMLAGLALLHLMSLHDSAASGNPLGTSGNYDRLPFAPYFIFKDLITIFIFMYLVSAFVFFIPNALGDSENYVMANPMQTPPAIVPEWYLLPFYAILRSIPNKLVGVISMFSAILIILAMALTDISKSRGMQYKPLNKTVFFAFVGILLLLMVLGAKHVESPFIEYGQMATLFYFIYYLSGVAMGNLFEISLSELQSNLKDKYSLVISKILPKKISPRKPYPFVYLNLKSDLNWISEIKSDLLGKFYPSFSLKIPKAHSFINLPIKSAIDDDSLRLLLILLERFATLINYLGNNNAEIIQTILTYFLFFGVDAQPELVWGDSMVNLTGIANDTLGVGEYNITVCRNA